MNLAQTIATIAGTMTGNKPAKNVPSIRAQGCTATVPEPVCDVKGKTTEPPTPGDSVPEMPVQPGVPAQDI